MSLKSATLRAETYVNEELEGVKIFNITNYTIRTYLPLMLFIINSLIAPNEFIDFIPNPLPTPTVKIS